MPETPLQAVHAARALAARHCRDCAWYHGAWPLWRALGIATTPRVHEAFYGDQIRRALREGGGPRVLVSGAADEVMLRVVVDAFRSVDAAPELVAVDRCETPLIRARRFANEEGLPLHTEVSDLLDLEAAPFDLVVTHGFLGYFAPAQRPRLARAWHRLLHPGGRLLTVNRLRPEASGWVGFTPREADRFVARVRAAADRLGLTPEQAEAIGRTYTQHHGAWPVRDVAEVEALLTGFAVEASPGPIQERGPTGPALPAGAAYLRVIAVRG